MSRKNLLVITSVFGALAVIIGAFGAHGLQKYVSIKELKAFETGVRYHFYHVLIAFVYLTQNRIKIISTRAIYFLLSGILLFSGSLYLIAITHITKLGIITPFGGVCFIIAWTLIAMSVKNDYSE